MLSLLNFMPMKTKMILFAVLALCMIGVMGCDDFDEYDVRIVKELPKITVIGDSRESFVIQSQKEVEEIFNKEDLQRIKVLQNIDFSKYTLLLGCGSYPNQVTNMIHSFRATGKNSYLYLLKVGGLATRPDFFCYGIIVDKLPSSAKVTFKIEEITLQDYNY